MVTLPLNYFWQSASAAKAISTRLQQPSGSAPSEPTPIGSGCGQQHVCSSGYGINSAMYFTWHCYAKFDKNLEKANSSYPASTRPPLVPALRDAELLHIVATSEFYRTFSSLETCCLKFPGIAFPSPQFDPCEWEHLGCFLLSHDRTLHPRTDLNQIWRVCWLGLRNPHFSWIPPPPLRGHKCGRFRHSRLKGLSPTYSLVKMLPHLLESIEK